MLFCAEIEANQKLRDAYHRHLGKIKDWYIENVKRYSSMITSELLLNAMQVDASAFDEAENVFDLSYQFTTKTSFFSISDALVKLILSLYSIGPSEQFFKHYGIDYKNIDRIKSTWIRDTTEESGMAEILACVLRAEGIHFSFDLKSLMVDRTVRSSLTHAAKDEVCYSTLRCYNNIRKMLVFLDPEYENQLAIMQLPSEMNLNGDDFMAHPGGVDFSSGTCILVVDSAHDVPESQRSVVANLAWDIVLDLDGYSNCGGLLDCVKHNKIQSEVITADAPHTAMKLLPDNTLWFRCGEYLSVDYNRDTLEIPSYADFHRSCSAVFNKIRDRQENMSKLFSQQLAKAFGMGRTLHIVVLTDNERVAKALIDAVQKNKNDDFFITWVGMCDWTKRAEEQSFGYDLAYAEEHFRYLKKSMSSAFSMLEQHRSQLKARQSTVDSYELPAKDGKWVSLSQNDRNNLRQYFNILFRGCEQTDPNDALKQNQSFFLGNQASWYTIANKYAVALKNPSEYNSILGRIKSLLGLLQDKADNRLFFISHKPGIGGSTLARQLAWSLHDQYPVLEVHSFSSGAIAPLIENLYDNIVETQPVVLLADDTLPEIDRLCTDVKNINRRCLLIVACRNNSSLLNHYSKASIIRFSTISDECIRLLRDRFRSESTLNPEELREKEARYYSDLPLDWQTPFIIGLYYRDRDFNINNYVSRALSSCGEPRFMEFVAFLAMCDHFQYKEVPAVFYKVWISENNKSKSLINAVPEIESLISFYRNDANFDCFHFRHFLLAEEYLRQYSKKKYGSSEAMPNAFYDLSRKMITVGAEGNKKGAFHENELTVLIDLLIRNKSADWQGTSDLMEEINISENQQQLMQQLAEAFQPQAQSIIDQEDGVIELTDSEWMVLKLTSHAFGHLGRLYAKKGTRNYAKASEMAQKSFYYRPNDDPVIYHMAGMSLLEKLENDWDTAIRSQEALTNDTIESFESEFQQAEDYFDSTIDMGSPNYGYPSLLRLYYHYLKFIYKAKNIHSKDDAGRLSDNQHSISSGFLQILDEAENCSSLEDNAINQIMDWKARYESGILFGDYSPVVIYYQGRVDTLKGKSDIVGYERAVKNLVFARIRKAQFENPEVPFYRVIKESTLRDLKAGIEELLGRPLIAGSNSDYRERSRLYHYWMQLAKALSTTVAEGLVRVRAWKDIEEERPYKQRDAEPYYYNMVLNYLNALGGSVDAIRKAHDNIVSMDNSSRRIRDVLVNGSGMGCLVDVAQCKKEEDILTQIKNRRIFEGRLFETKYGSAGSIRIYEPMALRDETARVEIGKRANNTLTDQQKGHKIQFLAGFSLEGIVAISSTAKDIDAGETLDSSDVGSITTLSRPAKNVSSGEVLEITTLQAGEKLNHSNKCAESGRYNLSSDTRRAPKKDKESNQSNTQKSEIKEVILPPPATSAATKEDAIKPGVAVAFSPKEITNSSCSGVFELNGTHYKGQIDLTDLAGKKTKKQAEILREQLKTSIRQRRFVRLIVSDEPQNGVYPLKSP